MNVIYINCRFCRPVLPTRQHSPITLQPANMWCQGYHMHSPKHVKPANHIFSNCFPCCNTGQRNTTGALSVIFHLHGRLMFDSVKTASTRETAAHTVLQSSLKHSKWSILKLRIGGGFVVAVPLRGCHCYSENH